MAKNCQSCLKIVKIPIFGSCASDLCNAQSGKGSIIEVPLLLLTSLRTHFFISKKRFLVLFPIKPMVVHHDFCCQAFLTIIGIILPKKIYCNLLHCPANPDINPLMPWPAHIAILLLFNLFFFWGVGLKSRHFNSICVGSCSHSFFVKKLFYFLLFLPI